MRIKIRFSDDFIGGITNIIYEDPNEELIVAYQAISGRHGASDGLSQEEWEKFQKDIKMMNEITEAVYKQFDKLRKDAN